VTPKVFNSLDPQIKDKDTARKGHLLILFAFYSFE
jgi:hypothetical protein